MANNEENDDFLENTGEKEYSTTEQGFAAYLATKFMFLDAVDTGEKMGKGQYGNKKAFVFLIPDGEDMDRHYFNYKQGTDETRVPAIVMFNKMRLMRQACRSPFTEKEGARNGKKARV